MKATRTRKARAGPVRHAVLWAKLKGNLAGLGGFGFAIDTAQLMGGIALGHLAIIAVAPVLTRVISPTEMGEFGIFSAYLAVLTVFASFGYDTAVVSARSDEDGLRLLGISLLLTTLAACLISLGLLASSRLGWLTSVPGWLPGILAVAAIVSNAFTALQYYYIREGKYGRISAGSFLTNAGRAGAQLLAGILGGGGFGLALGDFAGRAFGTAMVDRSFTIKKAVAVGLKSPGKSLRAVRDNYKCATYYMPANLLDILIYWMPIPAIALVYGTVAAGYVALVLRVLSAPIALFGKSIADVFHGRISQLREQAPQRIVRLALLTLGAIAVFFVPVSILLFTAGKPMFAFVFGQDWAVAGRVGEIMAPMIFFQVSAPVITRLLIVVGRQEVKLAFSLLLFLSLLILFWIATNRGWDLSQAILGYSLIVIGVYSLWFTASVIIVWRDKQGDRRGNACTLTAAPRPAARSGKPQ